MPTRCERHMAARAAARAAWTPARDPQAPLPGGARHRAGARAAPSCRRCSSGWVRSRGDQPRDRRPVSPPARADPGAPGRAGRGGAARQRGRRASPWIPTWTGSRSWTSRGSRSARTTRWRSRCGRCSAGSGTGEGEGRTLDAAGPIRRGRGLQPLDQPGRGGCRARLRRRWWSGRRWARRTWRGR